jgi:hypothetical protein
MLSPLITKRVKARKHQRGPGKVTSTTIREFGGGWNVIDAPAALSTKYASVLKNWYRRPDGSQTVRYGTEFKADIAEGNHGGTPEGSFFKAYTGTEQLGDLVVNAKSFGIKFTASVNGFLGSASIDVTLVTTGGTFKAGLYANNSGVPGVQLGLDSDDIAINTFGVKTFHFPTPQIIAQGQVYWLVFTNSSTPANITVRVCDVVGGTIATGKNDVISAITAGSMAGGKDLMALVHIDRQIAGEILDIRYFDGDNYCVTDAGEIAAVDADNVVSAVWNEAIAREYISHPTGWTNRAEIVTFTEIKGSLVICNGEDKPLEIPPNKAIRYLQDLNNSSNVNVPVGKYCCTVADYLCISGVPSEPNSIWIGAKGTIGVFWKDPDSDGVVFDVGAYVPEENQTIRGITSFRNYLFAHFFSGTIKIILGEYDADGNHVPRVEDTLQKFGLLGHRDAVPVVNDLLFPDVSGASTVRRNLISGAVEPSRLSDLIAPEFQKQVAKLTQDEMLFNTFGVHDRLSGHYMIFVPVKETGEVRAFVFTFNERMRIKAWSEFNGWTWKAATSSALGRVFFAKDTRLYQYGNEAYSEEWAADFRGEYDGYWTQGTHYIPGFRAKDKDTGIVWQTQVDHTSDTGGDFALTRETYPDLWTEYEGEEIKFDWEFPWTDAQARAKIKRLAFINMDTQGSAQFHVDIFVDYIYKKFDGSYDPALTLQYTGGDSPGYGGGDQPYGGGRRTTDARLWSHPVKFKLGKFRLWGASKKPLRIVALTLMFAGGKFGR